MMLFVSSLQAQESEPLNVFGYFQASGNQSLLNDFTTVRQSYFMLDQLNIYFQKDFGSNFGAMVNLEIKQNYSSENG
jgi:hypothetical protein